MKLEHGIEKGRAVIVLGSGGTPDSEDYSNGTWERFDAWSDSRGPVEEDYTVWVCKWLERIVRDGQQIIQRNKEGVEIRQKIDESGKRSVFKVIK